MFIWKDKNKQKRGRGWPIFLKKNEVTQKLVPSCKSKSNGDSSEILQQNWYWSIVSTKAPIDQFKNHVRWVPSAPSILSPRVRVPSTPPMLSSFIVKICAIFVFAFWKEQKINKKEAGIGTFLKTGEKNHSHCFGTSQPHQSLFPISCSFNWLAWPNFILSP